MTSLPKNYNADEAEDKWQEWWIENDVYKFDPDSDKPIYSIDTPPPTVSGKMHIGHAFSYTHADIIARYKRMQGYNVFYPFGTDDNGLATERLIERSEDVKATDMSRDDFKELTLKTLKDKFQPRVIEEWRDIGLSCDWDILYSTRDDHCKEISQRQFLDLADKDRVYRKEAPAIWCPECQTAISQVEMEDEEFDAFFNDLIFEVEGEELIIATTRPELLPACVAVFYHPEDERYQGLEGKKAKVPLFDFKVSIYSDERVDPEKGTGIVMCCTFGDQTDMEWQKAYDLPIKEAITRDGKMTELAGKYEGMEIEEAQKQIAIDLHEEDLLKDQERIKHEVNVHERCGTKVEYIHSKQWFIKYLDLKDDFLERGEQLDWYPEHMKHRYDNWIKGLEWDWCISRQRYSGVPFPVWYDKETGEPIFAKEENLPIDPLEEAPEGYSMDEVVPEDDIMDTWATSSLTPRIAAELFKDEEVFDDLLPMDLRPQAHDIITFWLFNTVVRSHIHDGELPWHDCLISGFVLDPNGEKMSKSKGNIVEPKKVMEEYSTDAMRFWAAESKPGEDLPYKEKDVKTGQKTIRKLWNASKLVLMNLDDFEGGKPEELEIIDEWILSKFNQVVRKSTDLLDEYQFSKAKNEIDDFFWNVFCDYYLEFVKDRLYNEERSESARESAQYTLKKTLIGVLKLFAPYMPHITEELYQNGFEKEGSIHTSDWPSYEGVDEKVLEVGNIATEVVAKIRKYKTENNMSLGTELEKVLVEAPVDLTLAKRDIAGISNAERVELEKGETVSVKIN